MNPEVPGRQILQKEPREDATQNKGVNQKERKRPRAARCDELRFSFGID